MPTGTPPDNNAPHAELTTELLKTFGYDAERGIPGVIYGAGPRTVLESHAKRANERLNLEDLRLATKVMARTLMDLLTLAHGSTEGQPSGADHPKYSLGSGAA